MTGPSQPQATVLITTKNRKENLRDALKSAVAQTAPIEILVIDDGSTDGTSELVKTEFPQVRLERVEKSLGLIVERNRGAAMAKAPVVISIDDDAAFSTPHTVEQTLREFDHPRIGAVAIPFINVNQNDIVQQRAPEANPIYITERYIGTAHALRRDVFLKLGGYREHFIHQGEEGDYCIRMLGAGYVVRLGRADPIHHFESPRRSYERMDYYGRRNDILYTWHNVPLVNFPAHLAATTMNGVALALRRKRFRKMFAGAAAGYLGMFRYFKGRSPVPRRVYQLSRYLKKEYAVSLAQFESQLPPMA